MITKYITHDWQKKIEVVEAERETSHSVWVGGRLYKKGFGRVHDTYKEAFEHLQSIYSERQSIALNHGYSDEAKYRAICDYDEVCQLQNQFIIQG